MTAIRALFSNPLERGGAAGRFLRSPVSVRLCGLSFVLGGLAGASHSFTQAWWVFGITSAASFSGDERLHAASTALMVLYTLLLSAGFLGLHLLLAKKHRWTWKLSVVGTLLVVLSGVGFCVGALYEFLAEPTYYASWGVLQVLFLAGYLGQPVGVTLVGFAVLWSRGLGLWRVVPLLAGLASSPLALMAVWWLFPTGNTLAPGQDTREIFIDVLLFSSPMVLAGIGWISVGFAVFGSRKREDAQLARVRRATESVNLSLANRLYEEAWGAGDVAVLDDIVAPDFFDRRHGRRGPEALKRAILDLRRTFPDLDFAVEEQQADGDTVTTCCLFSGTDRGGLLWYPPTDRRTDFTATYTDRFSDGRLLEHDGGADTADLLQQLGLTYTVESDRS